MPPKKKSSKKATTTPNPSSPKQLAPKSPPADPPRKPRKTRGTRKTRGSFAELKKARRQHVLKLWHTAAFTIIKQRHMRTITSYKTSINALLNPDDGTKTDDGSSARSPSRAGSKSTSKGSKSQNPFGDDATVTSKTTAASSHHSLHIAHKVTKIEAALAHTQVLLAKRLMQEGGVKSLTDAVFNLDAAINLRPHKCAPLQYLVDTYKGLFSLTNDYSYLTLASSTLQRFLTNIPPSPNTAYLFPTVIFNLATVYESFGAFEGALDLYGRILELFPTYDKYQLVLYRTVVVMLHLSGLKGAERGQLLQKCVEMVQFINESQADESELNKEHLLLVFARVMMKLDEHLKVDFNEKMVQATLSELFYIRKSKKLTGNMNSHVSYFKQVEVWRTFAKEFNARNEPTLAVDMFDVGILLLKKTQGPTMSYAFLLEIATTYAKFQDYSTAISYAQGAWVMEQYNPVARERLAVWSEDFKWYFDAQVFLALKIQRLWKTRIWSTPFLRRHHQLCVEAWEEKLVKNHFNMKVRKKLAYFAKNKWRGVFMYEASRVIVIQKFYRAVMMKWLWFAAVRQKHISALASVYAKWKRKPYNLDLRAQCEEMAVHKNTPETHNMFRLPALFFEQHKAALLLQRTARVWHAKAVIREMMGKRKIARAKLQKKMAWKLQLFGRQYMARVETTRRRVEHEERMKAASFLQKYWRNRKNSMSFLMKLIREKKEKEQREAEIAAAIRMVATWRMRMAWRMIKVTWRNAAIHIERLVRGHAGREFVLRYKDMYSRRIQRGWNHKVEQDYLKILLNRLEYAKTHQPPAISHWVNARYKRAAAKNKVAKYPQEFHYVNPTMNKSSVVFKTVKRQHSIIYDEHLIKAADHAPFSSVDCVMLSAVLKDGECGVEELILSRAKLGDKVGIRSLSDALEGNKSVLTLALSECDASWDSGLDQLFKVILTKNFNLRNLVLDRCGSAFGDGGGLGGALLVRDYFLNHFGGLVVLSLNSNCMTDVSGVMLGRALAENHLLEILQLSDNQFSDDSGVEFGLALEQNKRLKELDLSENYIQNRGAIVICGAMLNDNRTLKKLSLANNLITDKCVPLMRDVVKMCGHIEDFRFAGNQFRTKYMASLQVIWDLKMAEIEKERIRLLGDNSFKKTYAVVEERIRERGRKGGEKKSLQKAHREAIESVVKTDGEFFGPGGSLQAGVRAGKLFSPEGKGFCGGMESKLAILPFFREGGEKSPGGVSSDRSSDSRVEGEQLFSSTVVGAKGSDGGRAKGKAKGRFLPSLTV